MTEKFLQKTKDGKWKVTETKTGLPQMLVDSEQEAMTLVISLAEIDKVHVKSEKSKKWKVIEVDDELRKREIKRKAELDRERLGKIKAEKIRAKQIKKEKRLEARDVLKQEKINRRKIIIKAQEDEMKQISKTRKKTINEFTKINTKRITKKKKQLESEFQRVISAKEAEFTRNLKLTKEEFKSQLQELDEHLMTITQTLKMTDPALKQKAEIEIAKTQEIARKRKEKQAALLSKEKQAELQRIEAAKIAEQKAKDKIAREYNKEKQAVYEAKIKAKLEKKLEKRRNSTSWRAPLYDPDFPTLNRELIEVYYSDSEIDHKYLDDKEHGSINVISGTSGFFIGIVILLFFVSIFFMIGYIVN